MCEADLQRWRGLAHKPKEAQTLDSWRRSGGGERSHGKSNFGGKKFNLHRNHSTVGGEGFEPPTSSV